MNLPIRIFVCTLLAGACAILIAGLSIALPAFAALPRPLPIVITKPAPPAAAAFVHGRAASSSHAAITDQNGTHEVPDSIPLHFHAAPQPIPTHWKPVANVPIGS